MLTCFVKFGDYRNRGFLEFDSLAHRDNGIRLCTLCHLQFDNLLCPGFLFLLHGLRFFIDSEINDYNRRLEKAQSGCRVPGHRCPTSAEYLENQINIGAVPDRAIGGLYDRCMYIRNDDYNLANTGPKQRVTNDQSKYLNELIEFSNSKYKILKADHIWCPIPLL